MRKLAIFYLFLPLAAFGMDHPTEDSMLPTDIKGILSSVSSIAKLDDIHTEVRDVKIVSGRRKRSSIRKTAVVPGGSLDIKGLRKELEADGSALSVMPVAVPPSTNTAVSLTRTEPSTTAADSGVVMPYQRKYKTNHPKDHPSEGIVQPPRWQAELQNHSKQ